MCVCIFINQSTKGIEIKILFRICTMSDTFTLFKLVSLRETIKSFIDFSSRTRPSVRRTILPPP